MAVDRNIPLNQWDDQHATYKVFDLHARRDWRLCALSIDDAVIHQSSHHNPQLSLLANPHESLLCLNHIVHTEESCETKGLPTDPCLELQVTLSQLQLQQNKSISPMREVMRTAFDYSDSRTDIL